MKKLIVKEITCTATCRVMADLYIYQNTYCEANQLHIYEKDVLCRKYALLIHVVQSWIYIYIYIYIYTNEHLDTKNQITPPVYQE